MTNTKFSINEFITDYENNSDECYSFYDWFCKDESLKARAKSFVPKLKFLVNEGLLDGDNNYVWFKNNCPMFGTLYDDMRISSLKDDEKFLGGFCPRTGHYNEEEKASFWYFENVSEDNVFGDLRQENFKNWTEMKKALKTDEALRAIVKKHFGNA